jgi:hypothetical protein
MRLLKTILLLVLFGSACGQKVVLYSAKRFAKWPFENLFNFYIPDIPCSSVVFRCANGKIEQSACKVFYWPDSNTNTVFKVYNKKRGRMLLIDSIDIPVYEERTVEAWLGVRSGGVIAKKEAIALGGIIGREYVNDGHAEPVAIDSYMVITIGKNNSIESAQNFGNRYGTDALSLIDKMEPGDRLLFANIKAKDFSRRIISVKPLEFTLQ